MKPVRTMLSSLPGLLLGVSGASGAAANPPDAALSWPNTFVARVEALALLQTLNANLLGHDSATRILEQWCGTHRLAGSARISARISARRLRSDAQPPSDEQRRALRVAGDEPLRFRHVQLSCGTRVLSEAYNWYVPGRLTPEMNRQLESSDTPFGTIVSSLNFRRQTLSARLLWEPLPPGWEMQRAEGAQPAEPLRVPDKVLEHRALLLLADGTPISEVVETYTGNVLAFDPPGEAMPPGDRSAPAGR